MLRIIKYLKPYRLLILLTIVLLFVQAFADLALPSYMADIVNVGIQQGGVENAVPVAIRQGSMDKVTIFMSPEDKARVLSDYTLVDKDSPDYATYVELYPTLAQEPIYVLNEVDSAEIAWLNPVMGEAILKVSKIASMGFDLSTLPPGMDLSNLISNFPRNSKRRLMQPIKKWIGLSESVIVQATAGPILEEYKALGMDTLKLSTSYIIQIGLIMLVITLISGTCMIIVGYLSAQTGAGLARDLRRYVFQRVESFSATEFDKFSTASLITRSTNDITQIQMVVVIIMRMVFYAPIIAIGGIIRATQTSAGMWWIIALAVIVLLGLIISVFTIALPKFKIIQSLLDRLNLVVRENLSGMMVIRAFNMQSFEENRFDKANIDVTRNYLFVNRVMVIMMPLMMLVMNIVTITILWVGAHQVAEASIQVGDMMAFMQYAMQILFSFLMLAMIFIMLPRAAVSGDRVADVLETEPVIKDPQEPQQFAEPFKGSVEFRNVSFRYPGAEEDVLHNISFTAQPGQTTALIGTTGSGKSTIVNLIPRLYEVTEGAIYVDGTDIRHVRQHELRDRIGYIPQKGTLFSGTIESNLLYGDQNASDEELKKAVEIAQASEFIDTEQAGMQSEVAQGGTNWSGGQKQRLAIARALVKKAPIYIFDDSFSALDFKTDARLRKALKDQTGQSTMMIVTQRIATIKNAEQIIVLDEGKIVSKGTHEELMEESEIYRGIALLQLSKEELS